MEMQATGGNIAGVDLAGQDRDIADEMHPVAQQVAQREPDDEPHAARRAPGVSALTMAPGFSTRASRR